MKIKSVRTAAVTVPLEVPLLPTNGVHWDGSCAPSTRSGPTRGWRVWSGAGTELGQR